MTFTLSSTGGKVLEMCVSSERAAAVIRRNGGGGVLIAELTAGDQIAPCAATGWLRIVRVD